VDALRVKRVEYGLLKPHVLKMKILCVCQNRILARSFSGKRNAGKTFFEETITAENHPNILTEFITLLDGYERDRWFQQGWATDILRKKTAFLQEFFGDLSSGVEFGHHDLQTSRHQTYFFGNFLNKSLLRYPKATEQAVFGTDLQTVQKVAIGAVRILNAFL
jgi:hypothetical protein